MYRKDPKVLLLKRSAASDLGLQYLLRLVCPIIDKYGMNLYNAVLYTCFTFSYYLYWFTAVQIKREKCKLKKKKKKKKKREKETLYSKTSMTQ